MNATKSNYIALCEIAYNLTGNVYWLHKPQFDGQMKANFLTEFHSVKREVKLLIQNGAVYTYPLINFSTGEPKPYIGNSLNLFKRKHK